MKPVNIGAVADADVDRALEYYAAEAPSRGRALMASFRRTFELIGRTPGAGSPRFAEELEIPGLRHRITRGFPYFVFYLERDQRIDVVRVLHQRSDVPEAFQ